MKPQRFLLLLIDAVLIAIAWTLAYLLTFLDTGGIPTASHVSGDDYFLQFQLLLPWIVLTHVGIYFVCNVYRGMIRYVSISDLKWLIIANGIFAAVWISINLFMAKQEGLFDLPIRQVGPDQFELIRIPWAVLAFHLCFAGLFTGGFRLSRRLWQEATVRQENIEAPATLIVGTGDTADMALRSLRREGSADARPVCAVALNANRVGLRIHGIPVVGTIDKIPDVLRTQKIEKVLIALEDCQPEILRKIVRACEYAEVSFRMVPSIGDISEGRVSMSAEREIQVEDLLGREPVSLALSESENYLAKERILITGAGGSIGSELARQCARAGAGELVLLGKGENSIFTITEEIRINYPAVQVVPVIADIRDVQRMEAVFARQRPALVFHAAAHKHVPLMEDAPDEAVKNNVFGTFNVMNAAVNHGVKRVVMISSDKAVAPTSVMGATKRFAEMMMKAFAKKSTCQFQAVRFGNVMGSRGSVIPLFQRQIRSGGPVTVTHPDVERYFMTIPEAVSLVLRAGGQEAASGQIFVLDMGKPVRIAELAKQLISLAGYRPDHDIKLEYVGLRPGEKIHESLFTEYEEKLPTKVAKLIRTESPTRYSLEEFRVAMGEMENAMALGNITALLHVLHHLIPDYHPNVDLTSSDSLRREQFLHMAPAEEEEEITEDPKEMLTPEPVDRVLPSESTELDLENEEVESSPAPSAPPFAVATPTEVDLDFPTFMSDEPEIQPIPETEVDGFDLEDEEDTEAKELTVPTPSKKVDVLPDRAFIPIIATPEIAATEENEEEPSGPLGDFELLDDEPVAETPEVSAEEQFVEPVEENFTEPSTEVTSAIEKSTGPEAINPSTLDTMIEESSPAQDRDDALLSAETEETPEEQSIDRDTPPIEEIDLFDHTTPNEESDVTMGTAETSTQTPISILLRIAKGADQETLSLLVKQLKDNVLGEQDQLFVVGEKELISGLDCQTIDNEGKVEGAITNEALSKLSSNGLLLTASSDVLLTKDTLEAFRKALTPADALLAYSDYKEDKDGELSDVKLHDHNGCPHERFEFGPVIGYKKSALDAVGGVRSDLNFAWEYDIHLKLMEKAPFVHITECTYVRFIPVVVDVSTGKKVFSPGMGPLGGFSYVFYPEGVEKEVTSVFEDALKRRGCWLDHPTATVDHSGREYEVMASVVIPILNRQRFIGNAIDRVLEGTFQDFEIVIIDNGSTDGTIEEVTKYTEKDSRIKLLHGKGGSIASALNEGIKAAKGKYICQLDSDDEYAKTTLEDMIGHFESHPNCGLAISYYRLMDEDRTIVEDIDPITHSGYTRNQIIRRDGAGALRVFPKVVLEEFGYYDEEHYGNFGEDYDMVVKTGEKYDVDRVHKVLYHYRRHADNTDVTRDPAMKYNNKNRARQEALKRRRAINEKLGKV